MRTSLDNGRHGPTSGVVLGIGCRPCCAPASLRALVADVLAEHDLAATQVAALATIDARRGTPAIAAIARDFDRIPRYFSARALRAFNRCVLTISPHARRHLGVASVAESCALALALASPAHATTTPLLGPRRADRWATVAVARLAWSSPAYLSKPTGLSHG